MWVFMHFFYRFNTRFCKHVLLAAVGSTFLKSGPLHFTSKKPIFGPPSGKKMRHFGHFRPSWNLKKRRKSVYLLFMNPLQPHNAHTCMRHTCHLRLARWLFQLFYDFFTRFCKNVLPAAVGSTFLKSGSKHFTPFYIKKLMFWTPKRHEN